MRKVKKGKGKKEWKFGNGFGRKGQTEIAHGIKTEVTECEWS
jgi:hypothetical protein